MFALPKPARALPVWLMEANAGFVRAMAIGGVCSGMLILRVGARLLLRRQGVSKLGVPLSRAVGAGVLAAAVPFAYELLARTATARIKIRSSEHSNPT